MITKVLPRSFLETAALYEWVEVFLPPRLTELSVPTINVECPRCGSPQTFRPSAANLAPDSVRGTISPGRTSEDSAADSAAGKVKEARFLCCATGCAGTVVFLLEFGKFNRRAREEGGVTVPEPYTEGVRKVGEYPQPRVEIPPAVKRWLQQDQRLYQQAQQSLARGLGLGACAYLRRVVEDNVDRLLNDIPAVMAEAELPAWRTEFDAALASRRAAEKIKLIRPLLPRVLTRGGADPLGCLHDLFSEALHRQPDETCLAIARASERVLNLAISQLVHEQDAIKAFGRDVGELQRTRTDLEKRLKPAKGSE